MDVSKRTKYLEHRDDFDALFEYVKDLCNNKMENDAEKVILDAQKAFAIPIKIIEFFLKKKENNEILNNSLNDYPYSPVLHRLKIGFSHEDDKKIHQIEESIQMIGTFDADIWDIYRKLMPYKEKEIWEEQLSMQIINVESTRTLCQMETDIEIPPLTDKQKVVEEILAVYSYDFTKIQTCFALLDYEQNDVFYEMCINHHPYNPTLWLKYLLFKPDDEELSKRSVRFCFKSGRIWAMRLDHSPDIDMNNFQFFDKPMDANLILGKLCAIDKENTEQYCDAFLHLDVFKNTESFAFLFMLLDEYYQATNRNDKRKETLQILTNKYPNRYDLWMRRIDFVKSQQNDQNKNENIKEVRTLYKEALSNVNLDKLFILDSWMAFETQVSDNYNEVLQYICNEEKNSEITKGSESENKFGEKTIFVNNFGLNTTQQMLFELFEEFGHIRRITMKQRYAFVEFDNPESAKKAIMVINGRVVNGTKISVQPHVNKEKHTLFIKYDPTAKPESLISFLKSKTGIEKLTYRFSKNSRADFDRYGTEMKGLVFIDVETANDAAKLLALGNKELFHGKTLIVQIAKNNKKEAHNNKVKREFNKENDDRMKEFFGIPLV